MAARSPRDGTGSGSERPAPCLPARITAPTRCSGVHRHGGPMLAVNRRLALGALLALAALCALASWAGSAAPATAAPATVLPPVRHVWVVNLENTSYSESFGTPAADPYLASVLTGQGVLIQNYWGIGHNSADNYIAQISGQAPNPDTQTDCAGYPDFTQGASINQDGQAVGRGCVFPSGIKTLPDQLEAQGLTWKGYMQDMGNVATMDQGYTCAHPHNGSESSDGNFPDKYATKHDPFVFFHSIVDDPARCKADVVPMDDMF